METFVVSPAPPGEGEEIAAAIHDLGENARSQGDYERALVHFEESLELWRKLRGDNNRASAYSYGRIGDTYRMMGRYGEALVNITIAYGYLRETWTRDFRNQSWTAYLRGSALRQLGRLEEPESAHIEAVTLREQEGGVSSPAKLKALRDSERIRLVAAWAAALARANMR